MYEYMCLNRRITFGQTDSHWNLTESIGEASHEPYLVQLELVSGNFIGNREINLFFKGYAFEISHYIVMFKRWSIVRSYQYYVPWPILKLQHAWLS